MQLNTSLGTHKLNTLKKVKWVRHRLSQMTLNEVIYRLKKKAYASTQVIGLNQVRIIENTDYKRKSSEWLKASSSHLPVDYCRKADEVYASGIDIFAKKITWDEMLSDWLRDPKTGIVAPLNFGKTLNYRDNQIVGDIKYLWEPNRHLHLVILAQAYKFTNKTHYLDGIVNALKSWHLQNPYLRGPNWTSSLELAIRLINWSLTWQLIGGQNSDAFNGQSGEHFREKWMKSIYRHADFIRHHFSYYSSANNHLLGEAAGLFIASVTWPFWSAVDEWRKTSHSILIDEASKQNSSDGVNNEQAIMYQQFVLDFMLIAAIAGKANQIEFPEPYWKRIEVMLEYISSSMDVFGNMPMFGDADDGFVTRLSPEDDFCPYRSLLATGSVLFNREDFKRKSRKLDQKTIWLLGNDVVEKYDKIATANDTSSPKLNFSKGGYYIIGTDFETKHEVKCSIDCGPLGYLSIAAHGHADALSLWLSIAGEEVLIDPGTYAYHTNLKWRNYFRGTSAHNTVCVDGVDQSTIGGNFMWIQKANAYCDRIERSKQMDCFIGHHDGYMRLKDPVMHQREVLFDKSKMEICIQDNMTCKGPHVIQRFWHFSETCAVDLKGAEYRAKNTNSLVSLKPIEKDSHLDLLYGDEALPLGWVSRHYDHKVPTHTAAITNQINGPIELKTFIKIQMEV